MGLGQQLAHDLRGPTGIDEIVDQQIAVAVSDHRLQDFHLGLDLLGRSRAPRGIARHADRVDQADVQFAGHQGRRDKAAAGDGDDALPGALGMKELGEVPRVAVKLDPGDDDSIFISGAGHSSRWAAGNG